MKSKYLLLLLFAVSLNVNAQMEKYAIEEVILEAYVNGAYNDGILRNMELGFSPDYRSFGMVDGKNKIVTLQQWMAEVGKNIELGIYPRPEAQRVSLYYHRVEINGNMANVKVNRLVGGRPVAVEYIELFKYPTGWLIVSVTHSPLEGGAASRTN